MLKEGARVPLAHRLLATGLASPAGFSSSGPSCKKQVCRLVTAVPQPSKHETSTDVVLGKQSSSEAGGASSPGIFLLLLSRPSVPPSANKHGAAPPRCARAPSAKPGNRSYCGLIRVVFWGLGCWGGDVGLGTSRVCSSFLGCSLSLGFLNFLAPAPRSSSGSSAVREQPGGTAGSQAGFLSSINTSHLQKRRNLKLPVYSGVWIRQPRVLTLPPLPQEPPRAHLAGQQLPCPRVPTSPSA